jgi:hypothetical protein
VPSKAAAKQKQALRLLLVASPVHLARKDLRGLLELLETQKDHFELTLTVADPQKEPELLELYRLVATPALIKLDPPPPTGIRRQRDPAADGTLAAPLAPAGPGEWPRHRPARQNRKR